MGTSASSSRVDGLRLLPSSFSESMSSPSAYTLPLSSPKDKLVGCTTCSVMFILLAKDKVLEEVDIDKVTWS